MMLPRQVFSYPPVGKMVANLASEVAYWIVKGVPVAPRVVVEKRLAICNSCEAFDKNQQRCTICGCAMNAKAHMRTAKCPKNKWDEG
jgi:hypothetical protein